MLNRFPRVCQFFFFGVGVRAIHLLLLCGVQLALWPAPRLRKNLGDHSRVVDAG